ncbi:MAG: hypothetical protein PHV33_10310 [Elusimicrobiales bacterium]|nr:hypothetical protein [Elusimicrobiales bacterium]
MNKTSFYRFWVLAAALGLCAGPLAAGTPLKINFQGRLDESGLPAEGSKNFVFKIYDAVSGGNLVWTSQTQSLTLAEGVFSAVLSAGTPAALSTATFSAARYVEMTVDGVPLSPRQEMVSAPYALVAQALAPDAEIPPAAIADGSIGDSKVLLTTGAIVSGRFTDGRVYISTGAFYGGFNGADKLVQLDGSGNLPPLDGSALTGVNSSAFSSVGAATATLRTDLNAVITSTQPLGNSGNWDTAYGWGNHAAAGYAASASLNGVIASTQPLVNSGNWDTAYGWGDHAVAGYAASASLNGVIASTQPLVNSGNWDTAYGWGDHAAAGYAASASLSAVIASTQPLVNSGNWDTAYGWGNHAAAGYETTAAHLASLASYAELTSTQALSGSNSFTSISATVPGVTISSGLVVGAGRTGIGTAAPNSTLSVNGSVSLPVRVVAADYVLTEADVTVLVDASLGDVTVTLPPAAGAVGRVYKVKRIDSDPGATSVTLAASAGETIEGQASGDISTQFQSVMVQSVGLVDWDNDTIATPTWIILVNN